MSVQISDFGHTQDGRAVQKILLRRDAMEAEIITFGATLTALRVPAPNGETVDVVLGYTSVAAYEESAGYLGATVGRCANRIANSSFVLDGELCALSPNEGAKQLHGGLYGFSFQVFDAEAVGESAVRLTYRSADGEEGYPGNLDAAVTYTLTDCGLTIHYEAETDKPTLVNLTNHSYFNLNGGGSVLGHRLQLFAERFAENDGGCLPTGRLLKVEGTPLDFRTEKEIGADIGAEDEQLKRAGGYDHNYVLCGAKAAVLYSPETGIEMTVETDLPGMQLYSGNFLTERKGKGGSRIDKRFAACFETQLYPNAMNCYGFPSPVLRAGKHLHSETSYAFRVR